jgi:hypothetical protein
MSVRTQMMGQCFLYIKKFRILDPTLVLASAGRKIFLINSLDSFVKIYIDRYIYIYIDIYNACTAWALFAFKYLRVLLIFLPEKK